MSDQIEVSKDKATTVVSKVMNWAYDQAIEKGAFGLPGAAQLAEDHLKSNEDVEAAINSLIKWQIGKAGIAGFLTGLPGLITLPATLPADLAAVLYIQLRMVGAIAHLRGYDIHSDQVRASAIACLVSQPATGVLSRLGVKVVQKSTRGIIARISRAALMRINQAVGFRLVTKAGTTGIVQLSKLVPAVGGLVGGSIDAIITAGIAAGAKKLFVPINATKATGAAYPSRPSPRGDADAHGRSRFTDSCGSRRGT